MVDLRLTWSGEVGICFARNSLSYTKIFCALAYICTTVLFKRKFKKKNVPEVIKEHLIFDKMSSHKRETNRPKQTEKGNLEEIRTRQRAEQA